MQRRLAQGLALAFMVASLGAAQGPNISEAPPAPTNPTKPELNKPGGKPKPYQIGTASWYGQNFQGKETASGERYNMYDMTAAHLTLPIGSYVRVTNLRNGRAVVVRVNDRGPIVPGRIIDVSYGAAQALQFKSRGLQRVRLDLVSRPQTVVAKAAQPKPAYQTLAYNRPPVAQLP
ncbi:MAG TPA: septal ring lytic transglycosylase RlpA family protein [Terriglobales bacterium]|nr:septal ring lytic transglycosylase RlpA family protein [Terriglobales bacterium]